MKTGWAFSWKKGERFDGRGLAFWNSLYSPCLSPVISLLSFERVCFSAPMSCNVSNREKSNCFNGLDHGVFVGSSQFSSLCVNEEKRWSISRWRWIKKSVVVHVHYEGGGGILWIGDGVRNMYGMSWGFRRGNVWAGENQGGFDNHMPHCAWCCGVESPQRSVTCATSQPFYSSYLLLRVI